MIEKKKQDRNDLAEGPRNRTERNNFNKVGTCPALDLIKVGTCPALDLIEDLFTR